MIVINKLKSLINWRNKDGSFSIEGIIAMTGVLMVTFLGVAYFTYLVPRQVLTQDVHMLAQTAKIQGGLTNELSEPGNSDEKRFHQRMEDKGFDSSKIVITATSSRTTESGDVITRSAMGVEPLSVGYIAEGESRYSHRNSKEVISIHVTIPAKMGFINAMSNYWSNKDSGLSDYKFSEVIMSERW